jgi:RNA polymerase sigma factor (sigma-70 family)
MAVPFLELWFGSDHENAGEHGRTLTRSGTHSVRPATGARDHVRDSVLVRRFREGDGTAYPDAIHTYYPWLRGVALRFVASELAAEEIVDGAFARAWESRNSFAPDTTLAVFLFVAVRNAALNHVKHDAIVERQLGRVAADHAPGMGAPPAQADVALEQQELVEAVWRAVGALPERARLVITLRWRDQLDWPAVAAAMGTSLAAVQMQHSRALKMLRTQLPGYFASI